MTPREAFNILSQLAAVVQLDEKNGDIRKEAKGVLQSFLVKYDYESDAHVTVADEYEYTHGGD